MNQLRPFMETGWLGPLHIGMPYRDMLEMLGPTHVLIDNPNPVYRYAQVEIYVDGHTDLVWMIQLEPLRGKLELPTGLGLERSLDVPASKDNLVRLLTEWGIGYEISEHHVPGQEELKTLAGGVMAYYFEDGELSSFVKAGTSPWRG